MFGKAIWDKFPECIFWKFWNFKIFKFTRVIFPEYHPSQTHAYWLITQNQQYFVLKLMSFKSGWLQNSGQLQNNAVNGATSITVNRVITKLLMFMKGAINRVEKLLLFIDWRYWLKCSKSKFFVYTHFFGVTNSIQFFDFPNYWLKKSFPSLIIS